MLVTFYFKLRILRRFQIDGKPLRVSTTKVDNESVYWLWRKIRGMVKQLKIGQSAAKLLRSLRKTMEKVQRLEGSGSQMRV